MKQTMNKFVPVLFKDNGYVEGTMYLENGMSYNTVMKNSDYQIHKRKRLLLEDAGLGSEAMKIVQEIEEMSYEKGVNDERERNGKG